MIRGEPFYQSVRKDIEEKIKVGFYKKGEFIPSEGKLESYYNVSRSTIRNAVRDLVDNGYLTIIKGKGTRVTFSKLLSSVPNLISFTEIIQQLGMHDIILEMFVRRIKPNEKVAEKLDISVDDEVMEFYRVRAVDHEPMTIHHSYIPLKYLGTYEPELLEEKKSLYLVLRERYGIVIASAMDNIIAKAADSNCAKHLNIRKGDPILHMERVAYDQNDNIVEYSNVYYRGDRYTHTIVTRNNFR